jgi:hypothetical protein
LVDRPPPSRFSVVERGGRLVVIDKETGQTPLSAAERMDLHDRKMGVEPIRPANTPVKTGAAPDMSAAARAESGLSARPAPAQQKAMPGVAANSGRDRMAAVIAGSNKRPWNHPQPNDRPTPAANPAPARIAGRAAPQVGDRKTIVTAKWWDAKGPRTIELGAKGQAELTGGFMFLFFGLVIAAIVAAFVEPLILFVGAFVLFRFGGNVLGPIGAGIIDKALAEKG